MPYVNVPNDLSKIKTKIAFNLTKRQLICFGIGALSAFRPTFDPAGHRQHRGAVRYAAIMLRRFCLPCMKRTATLEK